MKWLVQTLDMLSSHSPEQEAVAEQKKLESLIMRYKNLIPTIEVTMVKTEVYSKCYTYRKEVREVCNLLKKLKEQSSIIPRPESLDVISQQIKQQEVAISQLEQQRSNIMSMLQRGKDLSKDSNAPPFVKDEVKYLETGWNEAYNETVERLNKLKGTQKLWSNYNEQKNEILMLLAQAEEELKRISPGQYNSSNIAADLQAKQEMSIHLRKATEDMLRKLRDLCVSLVDLAAPDKQPLLRKEVTEIEKRLQVTMETVQERVVYLQQFNTKWTRFEAQLGELKQWTMQNVPALLSSIQTEDISPEDRVRKTTSLQNQLGEKIALLDILRDESNDLLSDDAENSEAQKLKTEVTSLRQRVTALNQSVQTQSSTVTQDLSNWQKYQAGLQEVRPWVEQAEVKVAMGIPKPVHLQEAVRLQHEAKLFEKDCEEQLNKLQCVSLVSQQMTCKTNAPDEVDALHSRWTSVHDTAVQWAEKLDKLVANWKEFDASATKMENWIADNQKVLAAKSINLNTPQIERLEKELSKLKTFNNALSEQQAKLISLTQISDKISHSLTLEGANAVKGRVAEMKTKVTGMAEAVRGKINEISDAILSRQEFQNKLMDFNTWMEQLRGNIAQIDEVNIDKVDSSLQVVHALMQEHQDKHHVFTEIYEEVKHLTLHGTPEETKLLNETYTTLVENYKQLEDSLRQKKAAMEKWAELLNWHDEAGQQMAHIKYQLESQKATAEDLQKLITEIDILLTKITTWKSEVPVIDNITSVQIRDKASGKILSANVLVRELEVRAVNLKSRLENKIQLLQKVGAHWDQFQQLDREICDKITELQEKLSQVLKDGIKSRADVEVVVGKIEKLILDNQELVPMKDKLHNEGNQLMKDDQSNVTVIQKTLTSVDDNWDKLEDRLKEQKNKLSETSFAWKEFQESKVKVEKEIERVNTLCDAVQIPHDSTEAALNHDKVKKAMDTFKKSKTILDKMDNKGNAILKISEPSDIVSQIRSDLNEAHKSWSEVYERISKLMQTSESQHIIWKHIDETKNNLVSWLNEMTEQLNNALKRPGDVEAGQQRLAKYREELPSHLSLKNNIINKYEQLRTINNKEPLPTLEALVKLLEEQFDQLNTVAEQLDAITSKFGQQESTQRSEIKKLSNKISEIREKIINCEDLTGDNTKILQRLNDCRGLKQELQQCESQLQKIKGDVDDLMKQYPSFSETNLPKELTAVYKRYDGVASLANKIENVLLTFLKKYHLEKQNVLQRIIATQKEKVVWCLPEPGSDKYNLEVKLGSLVDVENGLQDCDAKKESLEESLKLLENIEQPEVISALNSEKNKIVSSLGDLRENYSSTKELLKRNIELWNKYELASDSIASWLKDVEGKIRAENVNQINMDTIDNKIHEITKLQDDVSEFNKNMEEFALAGQNILKEIPEVRAEQFVAHLNNRYQAIVKFVSNYLERLETLKENKELYKKSVDDVESWLSAAEGKVKKFSEMASPSAKPNQATLDELNKFSEDRENGQTLLNKAVEQGETLFLGIIPENRETIRTELRRLRDAFEALADKVSSIYKQVENILLQRSSFDDSFSQVKQWVVEANTKLGDKLELGATLPEKKAILHNYRSIAQEVNIHKNILKQLKEKMENLSDTDADTKFNESLSSYNTLADEVAKRISSAEKFVTNHEAYIQALEKSRDWLNTLNAEANLLIDESSTEDSDAKLAMVENLQEQKPVGDKIIASLKSQMETVLGQTSIAGHPMLLQGFQEQEKSWQDFLQLCSDARSKLKQLHSQWEEFDKIIDELESWIRQKENQIKDQSLRSTQEAKQTHLDKLRAFEEEILAKQPEFTSALEKSKSLEGESDLSMRVSKLMTRYKSLKNNAKEAIARYEIFVKEHKAFNDDYAKFVKWLSEREEEVQNLSHIVGDFSILLERQKNVRLLIDIRSKESVNFESLIEQGEKLYAHTSPDGREIIRQQLRNLRTIWDSFSDDLQAATNKLDQCLMQFQDFTASQEKLTKWLKDVEKAMHQHTELKATLQEKRAQLQNHKIMHQEIMSHQQLVESVCEKAQNLIDQTQDKSLNIYLQSIKQLFQNIVSKSQDLLENLEECVDKHHNLNLLIHGFKDWLNGESEKLAACDELTGEKADITKRLTTINTIKDNQTHGYKLLDDIKALFEIVSKSTAPKGNEEIQKEIDEMYKNLKNHLDEAGELRFYI